MEDYKKKYDELLLKLQKAKVDDNVCDEMYYRVIDNIVPELKESEDENIRKAIHIYFDWLDGRKDYQPKGEYTIRDMIAWLEQQGEQKQDPCDNCKDVMLNCHNFPCVKKIAFKQGKSVLEAIIDEKVDNANKVEQKFHEGDWVVKKDGELFSNGSHYARITDIDKEQYWLDSGTWIESKYIRLYNISDAKDGDVLVNGSNIFIFHFINDTRLMGYCHMNTDDGRFYDDIGRNECFCLIDAVVNPATKEQRELLFSKMKEARYEWDANHKQLKKIEQKSFWSEEDERQWNNIFDVLDGHFELSEEGYKNAANWVKAIKGRVQPQPKQKWSKDDKVMLDDIIDFFENGTVKLQHDLSLYASWLKSLKQRYTWKPSDEQIKAVRLARNFVTDDFVEHPTLSEILKELEEQLKKLK